MDDDEERIAWCRKEAAEAREFIDLVDNHGWRFEEGRGHEQMHDVTADRRAHWVRTAEKMDALAQYLEARSAHADAGK